MIRLKRKIAEDAEHMMEQAPAELAAEQETEPEAGEFKAESEESEEPEYEELETIYIFETDEEYDGDIIYMPGDAFDGEFDDELTEDDGFSEVFSEETETGERRYELNAGAEDTGRRIDAWLADQIAGTARSYIQKLIEDGLITVEGRAKTAKNYKLRGGDRVYVTIPAPKRLDVTAEDIPLDIVYEDEYLLVINKPKGMVVHPAAGNYSGTLVNALMHHCGDNLSSINGVIRPGIVHRIDKDTSGLLVVAKTDEAHHGLSEQLKDHSMTRFYRAVVYHNFREPEGTVDAPVGRDKKDRLRMAVTLPSEGRHAVTHYRQLAHVNGFSLIECRLETGRTHQIRVHMAYIRHPLLGDTVYGPKKTVHGAQSQMLHAGTLGFIHPITGEYMEFHREPPEEFTKICEKIGLTLE